jgi:PilZ domain
MSARAAASGTGALKAWCPACGTAHADPRSCPGELRATGSERPGWRVEVETPFGHEAIGVLLAPSHEVWRARILTYPNVLWTLPGGRGTIKFVGETAEEAERSAIAFIEEHVRAKRFLRRDGLALAANPGRGAIPPSALWTTAPRKLRRLPVRFGPDRPAFLGATLNLSAEGMFIGSRDLHEGGSPLHIHLDIEGHSLPLRGMIMWIRRRPDIGRPLGMGVRLGDPPPFYQSYVAAL